MLVVSRSRKLCDRTQLLSILGNPGTFSTRFVPFSASHPLSSSPIQDPSSSQPESPIPSSAKEKNGAWSKALLFLPGVITFGLGTWQIFRRQDKIEMLDHRRERLEKDPIIWNEAATSGRNLNLLEFRKVLAEGFFDESKSIFIGPRSRNISGVTENGYYVVTPLIPTGSSLGGVQETILVNRGWIPRDWRNKPLGVSSVVHKDLEIKRLDSKNERSPWWMLWSKKSRYSKEPEPDIPSVRVIGVIRGSENPSIFVPSNDPSSGQWFYVDVPMIARACGLSTNTIYIEDINDNINPSHPYPLPKDLKTLLRHSVMPQDHLNYTFTWYTLSAAVTFMAIKRIKQTKMKT